MMFYMLQDVLQLQQARKVTCHQNSICKHLQLVLLLGFLYLLLLQAFAAYLKLN